MEDHNSPAAVAARANQEDPLVMYLIVNEDLNMSNGKCCSQCGHGVQLILQQLYAISAFPEYREIYSDEETQKLQLFEEWLKTDYRKVVLKADSKEWTKIKEAMKDNMVLVIDNGLTQIPSGSETVIGIFPMRKSQAPKVIKKLQLLK